MRFFDMSRKPSLDEPLQISSARRQKTVQRLQIGVTGVVLMILLVGLASIIQDRARQSEATAVSTDPIGAPNIADMPQNDPLAEAGVVPDMPQASPTAPEANTKQPQGNATGAR